MQIKDGVRSVSERAIGMALALGAASLGFIGLHLESRVSPIERAQVEAHQRADETRAVELLTRKGSRRDILRSDEEILAEQGLLAANCD